MLTDAPSNAFCKNFLFEGQTHTYRGRDLPSASSLPIPTVARAGPGHSQEPGSHSSTLMKVAGVQVLEPSFAASRGACQQEVDWSRVASISPRYSEQDAIVQVVA